MDAWGSSCLSFEGTTVVIEDPGAEILMLRAFSIGSGFGFCSSIILPLLSTLPSNRAAFFFAYSEITIGFPPNFKLKKNFPDFEFLSGTTDVRDPALTLLSIDYPIGSLLL